MSKINHLPTIAQRQTLANPTPSLLPHRFHLQKVTLRMTERLLFLDCDEEATQLHLHRWPTNLESLMHVSLAGLERPNAAAINRLASIVQKTNLGVIIRKESVTR